MIFFARMYFFGLARMMLLFTPFVWPAAFISPMLWQAKYDKDVTRHFRKDRKYASEGF